MKKPILLFLLMWLIWAVWSVIVLPYLPMGIITEILNSVAVKALVWILPLVFFLKELNVKSLFGASFPWLPCVILLCVVTVFLNTLRLLNGLQDTFIVFDPVFILTSVSAGVIEELSFRGGFFAAMESKIGFFHPLHLV